jgi:nicotinamidase-related amidase
LEQILAAMDAAVGKVPTIVVQHYFPDSSKPFFQKGTTGWELHPEVKSRPHDLLVEKSLAGSFTGKLLEE